MTTENNPSDGSPTLIAHRLRFVCQARSSIALPVCAGPSLRGALFRALRTDVCCRYHPDRLAAPVPGCPICDLMATTDDASERGVEVPRPFTIEPMLSAAAYSPDQQFDFGLTLWGCAAELFPYLNSAVQRMGQQGIGNRKLAPGQFHLYESYANNPLTGYRHRLMVADEAGLLMPDLPITHETVLERAGRLAGKGEVTLALLTPLRLVSDGKLVHRLTFDVLARRLLRRVDQLARLTTGQGLDLPFGQLIEQAAAICVSRDETRWLDASSHSSRTGTSTPIGGLVGTITFTGDLSPFLPWLVWGEIAHVGKDATKGNGWYRLIAR